MIGADRFFSIIGDSGLAWRGVDTPGPPQTSLFSIIDDSGRS